MYLFGELIDRVERLATELGSARTLGEVGLAKQEEELLAVKERRGSKAQESSDEELPEDVVDFLSFEEQYRKEYGERQGGVVLFYQSNDHGEPRNLEANAVMGTAAWIRFQIGGGEE